MIKKVCVYCASSTKIPDIYKKQAAALGKILAENEIECLYGGGSVGLMGELSMAMLNNGGKITGIIPQFMVDEGWNNNLVKEIVVGSMHERKAMLINESDAIIALPGGCGTLEELLEAITWKQLGLHKSPIIILNIKDYYTPLLEMLDKTVNECFMREEHKKMWTVATDASMVIEILRNAPEWMDNARSIAAI